MFERCASCSSVLNDRRRRRGSIDFDLPEARDRARRRGAGRGDHRVGAQRRAPHHRGVHAAGQRDRRRRPREQRRCPALYRVHEAPDPVKVEKFEEFVVDARLQPRPRRPAPCGRGTSSGWSSGSPGTAGGEADRVPDAAHDAEGALRPGEPRATSAWRAQPTRTSRRRSAAIPTSSCTGCCARRGAGAVGRDAARGARGRAARRSPGTPRSGSGGRTRPSASWCSGRRSASWPTRSATSSTATSPASAPFGLFVELVEHFVEGLVHVSTMADDYYRFLEAAHAAARRAHAARVQAGRPRARAGAARGHGAAPDRPRAGRADSSAMRDGTRARRRAGEPDGRPAPERRAAHAAPAPAGQARGGDADGHEAHRHRHGRAHRSRQERARAGADRHRSRPAEGREGRAASPSTSGSRTGRPPGVSVAFVDVPGHERFVKNMLAGVGGIDAVMLVVAADESVMPQTREHFEICRLLQVPGRAGRADEGRPGRRGHARAGPRSRCATWWPDRSSRRRPSLPVSARTGEGLDALRAALVGRRRRGRRQARTTGRRGCRSTACSR